MSDYCFTSFKSKIEISIIPEQFNNPFDPNVPDISKIAAKELQEFLTQEQENWEHNFGVEKEKENSARGKMFGVLVVKNKDQELGYLSGFSGKLSDVPHHPKFVPSLFDVSTEDFFLDRGMTELGAIGDSIRSLDDTKEIESLKEKRKRKSGLLQQKIFDNYSFLNQKGESKSLCSIFENTMNKVPAAGAGECAAPKLLQYAFENEMQPIAIAEFWWGKTSKSGEKKHRLFYPACTDKCKPILGYMLG